MSFTTLFALGRRPAQQVDLSPSAPGPPAEMDPTQDEYIKRLEDEVRKR